MQKIPVMNTKHTRADQAPAELIAEQHTADVLDLYLRVKTDWDSRRIGYTPQLLIAHTALQCADAGIPQQFTVLMMAHEQPLVPVAEIQTSVNGIYRRHNAAQQYTHAFMRP